VVVDGVLDEAAWRDAPWTTDFVDILGPAGPPPPLRTRAKIAWSDTYLFIAAELEEPDLWATLRDHDDIVYRDDDFEVFLDPSGTGESYFEIEINAFGTILDLFLARPYNRGGSAELAFDVQDLQRAIRLEGTLNDPGDRDKGWAVELAIPWTALIPPERADPTLDVPFGSPPEPGDAWRMNFSRVDWPLEIYEGSYRKKAQPTPEHPHPESNWVWSPQGVVNMHVPERWGVVRFVDGPHNFRKR
jgi:hypothetical protein